MRDDKRGCGTMKKNTIFTTMLIIACAIYIPRSSSQVFVASTAPKEQPATASSGEEQPATASNTDAMFTFAMATPDAAPVFQNGIYSLSIPSSIGTITYYNQTDARWGNAIYGGNDTIAVYGCGPTVLSMLVSSFTEQDIPPDAMAVWARENQYWVNASGSTHALIPEGTAHYGLSVEPFSDYTEQGIIQALNDESIFVALVGPGHFTSSGHFIILADYWSGSAVRIVDPNSLENTQIPWEVGLILNELNYSAQSGGPLWKISIK